MKTVSMRRDFDHAPGPRVVVHYKAGHIYRRVPEAAVRAIIAAGAGDVIWDREQ